MVALFNLLVDLPQNQRKAARWSRKAVSLLGSRATAPQLMRSGKLISKPTPGRMYFFYYDPKTKAKLPFYDIFPLVFPVDSFRGGFVGLNFHYLPYGLRFKLLQDIQSYRTNNKFDSTTRLAATYNSLRGMSTIKPTIKKYLWKHVRSNFLRVDVDEMAIATYLPVAIFKKASIGTVFADSRRKI
jgi:hypothetical protein